MKEWTSCGWWRRWTGLNIDDVTGGVRDEEKNATELLYTWTLKEGSHSRPPNGLNWIGIRELELWTPCFPMRVFAAAHVCEQLASIQQHNHIVDLEVTEWNCIRNSAVSMRDINSSLLVLLIGLYGTLYLQQSSLAPVWLFLNEI